MEAYSMDLRQRVIRPCDGRITNQKQIAEMFGVSTPFITKLRRRRRDTGSIEPKPHGGGLEPKFDEAKLNTPQALVQRLAAYLGLEIIIRPKRPRRKPG